MHYLCNQWGHSGPFCHALSLLSLWTSILHCHSPGVATVGRRLRYSYSWLRLILVVVSTVATPGEWAHIFQMLLVIISIDQLWHVFFSLDVRSIQTLNGSRVVQGSRRVPGVHHFSLATVDTDAVATWARRHIGPLTSLSERQMSRAITLSLGQSGTGISHVRPLSHWKLISKFYFQCERGFTLLPR